VIDTKYAQNGDIHVAYWMIGDGPARAIRCAKSVVTGVPQLGLRVRAGVHTGEVELAGDGVRGIAVHTAHEWRRSPAPARCSSPER
jgi:hypothetical protein